MTQPESSDARPRGPTAGGVVVSSTLADGYGAAIASLAGLVLAAAAVGALWLASWRHLHIDESHNVFTMMLAMAWGDPAAGSPVELYHIVGGLLVRGLDSAADQYLLLRLVWSVLFVATAMAVGLARPLGGPGVAGWPRVGRVLVPAALALTTGPWWRHGFEVRHDGVLALGAVVLTGLCVRAAARPIGMGHRACAAAVAVVMQLDSHKAIILWGPAYLLLAWAESRHDDVMGRGRAFSVASFRLGVLGLIAGVVGLGVMGAFGCFGAYVERLVHFAKYATGADRFAPWALLEFFATRAPVITALATVAVVIAILRASQARERGAAAVVDAVPATAIMAVVAVLGLVVNPAPYPYNLNWLAPLVVLAAVDGLEAALNRVGHRRHLGVVLFIACVVVGVDGLRSTLAEPWSRATMKHQRATMRAVELLTDRDDTVLDGTGLVGTRRSPTRDWVLHSLLMAEYMDGTRERFDVVIAREHPPVILTGNYRWRWLPPQDLEAVQRRYIEARPGLYVLGTDLVDPVDAVVSVVRTGRYEVIGEGVVVDGAVAAGPVTLAAGPHTVTGQGPVRVVWLGPTLSSLSALPTIPSRGTYRSAAMPDLRPPLVWRAGELVSSSPDADDALPSAPAETR